MTTFSPAALTSLFSQQQQAFRLGRALARPARLQALDALLKAILAHEQALVDAVSADFGHRSAHETRLLELYPLVDEIRSIKRHLHHWMKPRRVGVNWPFLPGTARIHYQPLGVVGVIGAWNYPILLTLSPLANALAAGNHVMIKPSELAPATAAVMQQLIARIFAPDYITVITGGADIAAAFCALPFNHIIFTGSGRVGKLVMKAAAANLTPVTLELGGKSPAWIHESYPLATAADRIGSAKFWNAGQTCVAPDYVLLPAHQEKEFVHHLVNILSQRWPRHTNNPDYTHLINPTAWQRMQALVDDARHKGAHVMSLAVEGEQYTAQNQVFPPTLILNTSDDMLVMQEEIFGPILPIVTYQTWQQALDFINQHPHPLALYYFDRHSQRARQVTEQTTSGGVTINDCIFHLPQHKLPFGGVGPSGMGAYHGKDGFETFSKKKGILLQNHWVGNVLGRLMKPPYTGLTDRLVRFLLGR